MVDPAAKMVAARQTLPISKNGDYFTLETLEPGLILHRVHASKYAPVQFNHWPYGDARFSPIVNPAGGQITAMYAGTTQECALMETVFQSVPYEPCYKTIGVKFLDRIYSTVTLVQPLSLVYPRATALPKVGLTCESSSTRRWTGIQKLVRLLRQFTLVGLMRRACIGFRPKTAQRGRLCCPVTESRPEHYLLGSVV